MATAPPPIPHPPLPHLLFAKELSVLAGIRHPNITESHPKNKGGKKKKNK